MFFRLQGKRRVEDEYWPMTAPVYPAMPRLLHRYSMEARRYLGYFALITNEKMDAFMALHLYRMKDVVEKAFGNLKERLNMRRLLISSEKGLDRKIFTEFVALILISHLDLR